jgi:hypothetical protein
LFRKIAECGFKVKYDTDSSKMKILAALAFVPCNDVIDTFESLIEKEFNDEEFIDILNYFEDTWIGRVVKQTRRPPLFQIKMWNCVDVANERLPKTNNSVEGWNRSFSELVATNNPNIWKFINFLKLEQSKNEVKYDQEVLQSTPLLKQSRKSNELVNILGQYEELDRMQFLKLASKTFY